MVPAWYFPLLIFWRKSGETHIWWCHALISFLIISFLFFLFFLFSSHWYWFKFKKKKNLKSWKLVGSFRNFQRGWIFVIILWWLLLDVSILLSSFGFRYNNFMIWSFLVFNELVFIYLLMNSYGHRGLCWHCWDDEKEELFLVAVKSDFWCYTSFFVETLSLQLWFGH